MVIKNTLEGLPVELKELIIKHLDKSGLLALSSTNREFYELCTMPALWSEEATGGNFLWGNDSNRVLARLNMDRYRNLVAVTISSMYGYNRPMTDWVELLTAIQTLPKLLCLNLEGDITSVEPWLLADLVSGLHCVSFELCFGVTQEMQTAVINSLASPTCVTRHLTIRDLDLQHTMHICRSMIDALKYLWHLDIDDRCLSDRQLRVLNLIRSSSKLVCVRRDFDPNEICRFHTRARKDALDAEFQRFWAAAGMDN